MYVLRAGGLVEEVWGAGSFGVHLQSQWKVATAGETLLVLRGLCLSLRATELYTKEKIVNSSSGALVNSKSIGHS